VTVDELQQAEDELLLRLLNSEGLLIYDRRPRQRLQGNTRTISVREPMEFPSGRQAFELVAHLEELGLVTTMTVVEPGANREEITARLTPEGVRAAEALRNPD
jgi:hypothetical protein